MYFCAVFYLKSAHVLFFKLNAMWFNILSNAMTSHTFELHACVISVPKQRLGQLNLQ